MNLAELSVQIALQLKQQLHGRRQAELESRLIEEETERCVSEAVESRVKEVMASQAVQQSLQERLVRERKLLEEQVGHINGDCAQAELQK